jgi:hypothetical protein
MKLLDSLREVADHHLSPERGLLHEVDIAEGFRNALHLLNAATELYFEGDPERPEFSRIVSPTRKLMGDNPDAIYHFARLRGDRSYRVTGRRGDECYVSFTVHGRGNDGRLGAAAEPVLADVNDRSLAIGEDGSFEIILSPEEQPGDWIRLAPSAASLIVRHYYEFGGDEAPAANPDRRIELRIEPLEKPPSRPPISDALVAERLADVTAFVRGATVDGIEMTEVPVPFVSRVPNQLPEPSVFRTSEQDAWGAVDIAYAMCPFELGEEEALLMEGRFPDCAFANVVLWNRHMQCFEFRDRRTSLNRKQTVLEPDGSFRMVVAHRDPGLPNWIDTEGHQTGTIFWRFLLPTEQPEKPICRVVPLAQLGS